MLLGASVVVKKQKNTKNFHSSRLSAFITRVRTFAKTLKVLEKVKARTAFWR